MKKIEISKAGICSVKTYDLSVDGFNMKNALVEAIGNEGEFAGRITIIVDDFTEDATTCVNDFTVDTKAPAADANEDPF